MPSRKMTPFPLVAVALLAAGAAPAVQAADASLVVAQASQPAADSGQLEEVVVSARRRQENAQDVPIPMAVITAETLTQQGIDNPRQLNALAPSMVITETNPRQTNIGIRGIGNTSLLSDGLTASVGVYEDGVFLGRPGEFSYDFKDIDQITVQRGPQGTLYGRNTTGGAINVSSKLPSFTPEATAGMSFGNYFLRAFDGSVSGPVVGDKLALRLTAYDTERDGTIKNTNPFVGGRENEENRYGFRAQALFVPTDDFTFRLIASYRRQDERQSDYQIYAFQPAGPGKTNPYLKGISLVSPGYMPPLNPYARVSDVDAPQQDRTHDALISGEANWDFGGGYKLTSITAYQNWYFRPNNDGDNGALPVSAFTGNVNKVSQYSQELRVTSPTGRNIEYVSGLYYYKEMVNGLNRTYNEQDAWAFNSTMAGMAGNAAQNAALSAAMNNLGSFTTNKPKTDSYAAFSQATWHIDEKIRPDRRSARHLRAQGAVDQQQLRRQCRLGQLRGERRRLLFRSRRFRDDPGQGADRVGNASRIGRVLRGHQQSLGAADAQLQGDRRHHALRHLVAWRQVARRQCQPVDPRPIGGWAGL